ncbi:MAG: SPOR domain-containing protein [Paludibacteraceae bacterium]
MKLSRFIFTFVCIVPVLSACKVQNAPGAYIPAEGKAPAKEVLTEKPKETPKPQPAPVVATEPAQPAEPVVETQPIAPAPVEKEVTRAEVFSVVEGESENELKNYHVVIGSFKNQDNAKRLQARMRPEYKPVIVINEQGMYRVLLISFDDYASAKQKIAAIHDQFGDAWVLVQKK